MVATLHEPDWTEEAALEESDLRLTYLTVVPLPDEDSLDLAENLERLNGQRGVNVWLTCFGIVLVLGALLAGAWL